MMQRFGYLEATNDTPYRLAGLELASAIVLGHDPATTPLGPASSAATPRAALERSSSKLSRDLPV